MRFTNTIDELIHTKSYETIAHVIPQKGAYVEVGNRVLIGLVKEDNRLFQAFMDGTATLYYSGKQFPTTIALQDLHFFMPYIKGKEYVMCMRLSRCGLSRAKRQNKRMKMMPTARLSAWLLNFGMFASNMQNSNQ